MQSYTVYFIWKLLYMFRVVPPPIIRSAPDDERWYHPKRVEQFPDINKLCNVASCWIYIGMSFKYYVIHTAYYRTSHILNQQHAPMNIQ